MLNIAPMLVEWKRYCPTGDLDEADWHEVPDINANVARDGVQAVRSKLGRLSSVMRLRIRTPTLASVF
jgi:hypothetical protein